MTMHHTGSGGRISHGQVGGLLACIAMLLLAIALALHFAPAGEEVTGVRNVEMPGVCVEGRFIAEVRTLLTDSLAASGA